MAVSVDQVAESRNSRRETACIVSNGQVVMTMDRLCNKLTYHNTDIQSNCFTIHKSSCSSTNIVVTTEYLNTRKRDIVASCSFSKTAAAFGYYSEACKLKYWCWCTNRKQHQDCLKLKRDRHHTLHSSESTHCSVTQHRYRSSAEITRMHFNLLLKGSHLG